jgi:hypothetical protein
LTRSLKDSGCGEITGASILTVLVDPLNAELSCGMVAAVASGFEGKSTLSCARNPNPEEKISQHSRITDTGMTLFTPAFLFIHFVSIIWFSFTRSGEPSVN